MSKKTTSSTSVPTRSYSFHALPEDVDIERILREAPENVNVIATNIKSKYSSTYSVWCRVSWLQQLPLDFVLGGSKIQRWLYPDFEALTHPWRRNGMDSLTRLRKDVKTTNKFITDRRKIKINVEYLG